MAEAECRKKAKNGLEQLSSTRQSLKISFFFFVFVFSFVRVLRLFVRHKSVNLHFISFRSLCSFGIPVCDTTSWTTLLRWRYNSTCVCVSWQEKTNSIQYENRLNLWLLRIWYTHTHCVFVSARACCNAGFWLWHRFDWILDACTVCPKRNVLINYCQN